MTPAQLAILHGFFWLSFGGCLLALFAYDIIHYLFELLPDVALVVSRLVIALWGKKS